MKCPWATGTEHLRKARSGLTERGGIIEVAAVLDQVRGIEQIKDFSEKHEVHSLFSDFTKAIELDKKLALAYASRGLVRLLQGKPGEAENDFAYCLHLDSSLRPIIEAGIRSLKHQPAPQ